MIEHRFIDLFGVEQVDYVFSKNDPKGYAHTPGTGPKGETCKTCEHRVKLRANSKRFYKCGKNRDNWSHSITSDIVLKMPACNLWEPSLSKTPRNGNLR